MKSEELALNVGWKGVGILADERHRKTKSLSLETYIV